MKKRGRPLFFLNRYTDKKKSHTKNKNICVNNLRHFSQPYGRIIKKGFRKGFYHKEKGHPVPFEPNEDIWYCRIPQKWLAEGDTF